MHPSAMQNCKAFIDSYFPVSPGTAKMKVVDIGAQDIYGSLREVCHEGLQYVGVDMVSGKGVDIVLEDPYVLPFPGDSVDAVLSSSCFEHCEMFWVMFLEILRVLRPGGLFYLNVPSNGDFHRYPVDCWRFYPDSGNALVAWARRSGFSPALLESYVSAQDGTKKFNDFVAVFVKDESHASVHKNRILHSKQDISNGLVSGRPDFINPSKKTEDQKKLFLVEGIVNNRIVVNVEG